MIQFDNIFGPPIVCFHPTYLGHMFDYLQKQSWKKPSHALWKFPKQIPKIIVWQSI
jgi:hypothetical protein